MTILDVHINMRMRNAPAVRVEKLIVDPATGEERQLSIQFVDDDARGIVTMVPNPAPGGTGTVVHPAGKFDQAALVAAVDARIAEVTGLPKGVADRLAAAEKARVEQKAAENAKAAIEAEHADLTAQIEAKRAELALLDGASAELASKA